MYSSGIFCESTKYWASRPRDPGMNKTNYISEESRGFAEKTKTCR